MRSYSCPVCIMHSLVCSTSCMQMLGTCSGSSYLPYTSGWQPIETMFGRSADRLIDRLTSRSNGSLIGCLITRLLD